MVPIGALIGSFFGGFLSKYGRRIALLIIDVISIVGVFVCIMALGGESIIMLMIGRGVCGFAVGL